MLSDALQKLAEAAASSGREILVGNDSDKSEDVTEGAATSAIEDPAVQDALAKTAELQQLLESCGTNPELEPEQHVKLAAHTREQNMRVFKFFAALDTCLEGL